MKEKFLSYLLPHFVSALINTFGESSIKNQLDKFIDQLENVIELSETKVDDALLPLIYMIRNIFDIPDND